MKDHNSDLYINWKTSSVPKENEANDMDTDDPVIFPDANDKEGVTDTDAVLDFSAKEEGIFPETNDMGTDDPVILPGDGDVTDTDAVLDFSAKEEGIFPETEDMGTDDPVIFPDANDMGTDDPVIF